LGDVKGKCSARELCEEKKGNENIRTNDQAPARCHNLSVAPSTQIPSQDILRNIWRIQAITIAWMCAEATLSLWAAWTARSPALAAFGGDSTVELLSAVIVLWRFRTHASEDVEQRTAYIGGSLLFVLSAYVMGISVMSMLGYNEPKPSYLGMLVLVGAATIMPVLAQAKRRLSALTKSAALRADAAESALCAYLAIIALVCLAVRAIWHIAWADPLAALVIVPFIMWEAQEVIRGKACCCS
jgi:divalent metal cation (Fe/Co/Zn/Cd) transporter